MKTPFLTRMSTKTLSFDIGTLMQRKYTPGDIGIEIEVEGNKFPKLPDHLPEEWVFHEDHSLRGQDNAEYVLRAPLLFDEVAPSLDRLWESLIKYGSVLDDSNRTSVHIHLNVQKFHLKRLCSFMGLYFCFEEILTEWCGEHRVGNLFCLRAKDAPGILTLAKKFLKTDANIEISDHYHYAGFNMNALQKFGSIEIRTLRGVSDFGILNNWVRILRRLYELSDTYDDPRDVISGFSGVGPSQFFEEVFGFELAGIIKSGLTWYEDQFRDSLYEGIRFAQDLCYCRDWSLLEEREVKPDPFGRDKKKIVNSLINLAQSTPASPAPVPAPYPNHNVDMQDLDFEEEFGEPDYDD